MRQAHLRLTIVAALIAMLCATAHAAKDKQKSKGSGEIERKVTEKQVPAAALKTLKKLARKAEITEFAEEIEHGSTFYEGSWKTKAGANMDVLVTKAGDLVEIEEQIPTKKLPSAALKAAQKLAGKGAKISCESKTMILYEIKFTRGDARHEVLLTPDGRIVEQETEKGTSEDGDEDEDEDEEEVSIKDVPKAVRATILKHARKGKVEEITKETEDGKVIYDVEIEVGDKEYELEIAANGKLLEKELDEDADDDDDDGDDEDEDEDEEEVSIKDVPKAVRATILKHARKGKVEEITKETEDGKVIYDVEIEVGDKEYELEIAADGKLLEKELDEDADDDDEDEDDDDEDDDEDADDEDEDDDDDDDGEDEDEDDEDDDEDGDEDDEDDED